MCTLAVAAAMGTKHGKAGKNHRDSTIDGDHMGGMGTIKLKFSILIPPLKNELHHDSTVI